MAFRVSKPNRMRRYRAVKGCWLGWQGVLAILGSSLFEFAM